MPTAFAGLLPSADFDLVFGAAVAAVGLLETGLPEFVVLGDCVLVVGVVTDGVLADGVLTDGVLADGVLADGVQAHRL